MEWLARARDPGEIDRFVTRVPNDRMELEVERWAPVQV
jgi:hypothetical protein